MNCILAQDLINKYINGSTSRELANEYNITQAYVIDIVKGRSYANLHRPNDIDVIARQRLASGPVDLIKHKESTTTAHRLRLNEKYNSYKPLTVDQNDIITGSLLGDGYITKKMASQLEGQCCFRKKQCLKYKEYVNWLYERLLPYSRSVDDVYAKTKVVNIDGKVSTQPIPRSHVAYIVRTINHPLFTELRNKWYPEGKKIVPEAIAISPLAIAIWFCDGRSACLCTQCFTLEEAEILSTKLQKYNIKPNIVTAKSIVSGTIQPRLMFRREAYDSLIDLIKPYIESVITCFHYKVKCRKSSK